MSPDEDNEKKAPLRTIKSKLNDVRNAELRFKAETEDLLAIGAAIVAILIAAGIVFKTVDTVQGGAVIVGLVGAAGIAKVIRGKRSGKKD